MKEVCRECINTLGGCCCFAFADGWKIVLTPSEIRRLSEVTHKAPEEFIDTSPLVPYQFEAFLSCEEVDPLWARLFSLWLNPTGIKERCPFLLPCGCSFSYKTKPFVCRAYPLNFNLTAGEIFYDPNIACLVIQKIPSLEGILDYFEDRLESLSQAFKSYREELLLILKTLEEETSTAKGSKPIWEIWHPFTR